MELNFVLNCTTFSLEQLKSLNTSRGASGSICSVITVGILKLLLYNKSYKSVLQRTFLYLTMTTLLLEIFHAMQIERQLEYPGQDQFCSALGFLIQTSGGVNYMLTLAITILLLYTVYEKLRGCPSPAILKSSQSRVVLEILLVLGAITISLSYQWVPFVRGNYGLAGAYCWIRGIDENCTDVGSSDQLAFYIVAETIGTVSILAMLTLAVIYCRIAYKYKTVRRQQLNLVRQNLILMCFLMTHVVFLTVGLVARYITASTGTQDNYTLWFLNAAGIPFSLLVIPIGFLVYLYTIRPHNSCCSCRKPSQNAIKGFCTQNCWCFKRGITNEFSGSNMSNTNPSSHPVVYPSHTTSYWNTPYTGAFTTISNDVED